MLTRLEVDGFKNLLGFVAEFGAFTCIAGPNGSGKSNVFDAVRFLSLLADHPIMDAAARLRASDGRGGDPRELFWTDGHEQATTMRFAAEMVVPREVQDDFGRQAAATITFLRYELELGYEPSTGPTQPGRLVLKREELKHINKGDARHHMRFPHRAADFRWKVVRGRRSGSAFISTVKGDDGTLTIQVHGDGGTRGPPRPSPAESAPRTIVSTTTTSSDPTILAARRELQSWRFLALEPAAMRGPDPFSSQPRVGSNGSCLAATLFRLATEPPGRDKNAESEPLPVEGMEDVYAKVANRLSRLVDVEAVRIDRDDTRELLTLQMKQCRGAFFPARALSDGTLRFLALCLIDADPSAVGLICLEEPENGIHPARMQAMVDLVRGLAVDVFSSPGSDNPMRQVIVNTHSPRFVTLQMENKGDLLFAEIVTVRSPKGHPVPSLRLKPFAGTWRCDDEHEPGVGVAAAVTYLTDSSDGGMQLTFLSGDGTSE